MITIKNGQNIVFLIYKTHLPLLEADHRIILKNLISEREAIPPFQVTEYHNSFRVELDETDLSAIEGQGTMYIENGSGDIIYTEEVYVI